MFQEERTELKFEWSHLGDIEQGRPNLGAQTNVVVYRLMQYTLRDATIRHTGVETANAILREAGWSSGKALYENLIAPVTDFDHLISKIQTVLRDLKVGIFRVEQSDLERLDFFFTVAEDLDCSGLPMLDEAICLFDEGLIAGLLEAHVGTPFEVREVDCWCTGERVCRFRATPAEEPTGG